jgi:hypothetical protein
MSAALSNCPITGVLVSLPSTLHLRLELQLLEQSADSILYRPGVRVIQLQLLLNVRGVVLGTVTSKLPLHVAELSG